MTESVGGIKPTLPFQVPPPPPPPPAAPKPKGLAAPAPALPGVQQAATPNWVKTGITGPLAAPKLEPQGAILRRGAQGPEVRRLQELLQHFGGAPQLGPADGRLNKATEDAVRNFQAMTGIEVDGESGPHTKSALEAAKLTVEAKQALMTGLAEQRQVAAQKLRQADDLLKALPPGQGGPAWSCLGQLAKAAGLPLPTRDPDGHPTGAAQNPHVLNDGSTWNGQGPARPQGPEPGGHTGQGPNPAQAAPVPPVVGPPAPSPDASSLGERAVAEARKLHAAGYRYPPNLTSQYHHKPFQVGCCADFAVDAWNKAGVPTGHLIKNPHYCPSQREWLEKQGAWANANQPAKVGDWVFFHNGSNKNFMAHVAMVTAVDAQGKPTRIIESYAFNARTRERELGNSARLIAGYGRLDVVAARRS